MSIKNKIQTLIAAANTATGESDATLTDAVQTLVDGFGQGGGYTAVDWLDLTKPTGDIVTDVSMIPKNALYNRTGAITVTATVATVIGDWAFQGNTGITRFFGEQVASCSASAFQGATNLEYVVLGKCHIAYTTSFADCPKLKAVDLGGSPTTSQGFCRQNMFKSSRVFNTLVLRGDTVWPLSNINIFDNTPFASGGSGGTIYIKKALYDHLGDGSSLDYQAVTNWSTILGYANNQILPIEGSIYETQYADGTPIT